MIGIYKIECLKNGMAYIGKSKQVQKRWTTHKTSLSNGTHHNKLLQKDWDKFGETSFNFEILEWCECDDLYKKESYYYSTTKLKYNLADLPNFFSVRWSLFENWAEVLNGKISNVNPCDFDSKVNKYSYKAIYNTLKISCADEMKAFIQWYRNQDFEGLSFVIYHHYSFGGPLNPSAYFEVINKNDYEKRINLILMSM